MINTIILVFLLLLLIVLGMSIGVIASDRRIKGSCGGVAKMMGTKSNCNCDNPCEKRKALLAKVDEQKFINELGERKTSH